MLFKNFEDVKEFISVNLNFDFMDIKPSIRQAERVYILPAIGKEFYKVLNDAYNSDEPIDEKLQEALALIQEALAQYAYFVYIAIGSVEIGNAGILETSASGVTPARQWVVSDLKESLLKAGDVALDAALEFLEENKDDYPDWSDSDFFTLANDLFLNSANELSQFVNIQNSRRTFLALRPYIAKAERFFIKPTIGESLFNEIKDQLKGELSEANEIILKRFIQPATAQFAICKAIPELLLKVSADGIRVKSVNNGITQKANGSDTQLSELYKSLYWDANSDLTSLKEYLTKHIEDYPLYMESKNYYDPTKERPSPNSEDLRGYIA
jgi:hypothetical protein